MNTSSTTVASYAILSILTTLMPASVSAQGVGQLVGYLNILVGLMLVAAFLCFGSGFVVYISRLGLVGRDWGIQIMSWGVAILFVLVVMLWGVRFVQTNPKLAITIVAFVVFIFIGKFALDAVAAAGAEEEEH